MHVVNKNSKGGLPCWNFVKHNFLLNCPTMCTKHINALMHLDTRHIALGFEFCSKVYFTKIVHGVY